MAAINVSTTDPNGLTTKLKAYAEEGEGTPFTTTAIEGGVRIDTDSLGEDLLDELIEAEVLTEEDDVTIEDDEDEDDEDEGDEEE